MKILPFLLVAFLGFQLHAQTKTDPGIAYYDAGWNPVAKKSKTVMYQSKTWQEGNEWIREDYYFPEDKLQMTGRFLEKSSLTKHGNFVFFYPDGVKSDSGRYERGKMQGIHRRYYSNGTLASEIDYNRDKLANNGKSWFPDGTLKEKWTLDEHGTGTGEVYDLKGRRIAYGGYLNGEREGVWFYENEAGKKVMQTELKQGAVRSVACIDAAGNVLKTPCIQREKPEFDGGAKGWVAFLEKNLKYPELAQRRAIYGLVMVTFLVDHTGAVSNISVISSPHQVLSDEVIRIMKLSPRWLPATVANTPIDFMHVQAITFRLE